MMEVYSWHCNVNSLYKNVIDEITTLLFNQNCPAASTRMYVIDEIMKGKKKENYDIITIT